MGILLRLRTDGALLAEEDLRANGLRRSAGLDEVDDQLQVRGDELLAVGV